MTSLFLFAGGVSAQEATPTVVIPAAADCTREARSVEELGALIATPVAPVASPAPGMPAGQAADEETTAAIEAAVYEFIACSNAGDSLRVLAFYSDRMAFSLLTGALTPEQVPLLGTPTTVEPGMETVIIEIGPVIDAGDGRYAVTVVGDDRSQPAPPRPVVLYWAQENGEWVIVDVYNADFQATPTP
jgi:hypothetical protein